MFRIVVLMVLVAFVAPAAASAQSSMTRSEVKEMQRALGVRADGQIGPRTRRAIRRFERRNDLQVDGRPDPRFLEALGVAEEPARDSESDGGDVDAVLAAAEEAIGSPYVSGGTDLGGFDCSGLTQWAFGEAGIDLPRTSFDQYEEGEAVDRADVEPGDLVFFDTAGSGASHVGIATGADTVISATSSRGVIEHASDDAYWGGHYVGARRVVE